MTSHSDKTEKGLTIKQDRALIRSRWHSARFVVAHVTAPVDEASSGRPPVNLGFVIDRSGSMDGPRIQMAVKAVEEAISLLKPSDRFSIVIYDDQIETLVSGVMATSEACTEAAGRLRSVRARNMTNLGGGWLKGAEHVASELMAEGVNRVLLLTDGLANVGMTDPAELAHHAGELRRRGVSTSTFGVGDAFNEVLLQAMAQAGGGQFYDIATPVQIRDHIGSEVGETLEIVARDVMLDIMFPQGVRLESLGAFQAKVAGDRAIIDLGDLVSGQEIEVPLRLSFPTGAEGESTTVMFGVTGGNGAFQGAADRASFEYADDHANDVQPRVTAVDRVIAEIYAARARQQAVELNRQGDYDGARDALRSTARRIRMYAAGDPVLIGIIEQLVRESEMFHRDMAERSRKAHYATSNHRLRSRDFEGKAQRRADQL